MYCWLLPNWRPREIYYIDQEERDEWWHFRTTRFASRDPCHYPVKINLQVALHWL